MNHSRAPFLPVLLASVAGLVLLPRASHAACDATQCTMASLAEAQQCLEFAASFAGEGAAYDRIVNGGFSFTPQDTTVMGQVILPLSHESPAASISGYRAACVQEIIDFARDPIRVQGTAAAQLLIEASFRKASAHGMFGDDRLLRALNSALDPNLPGVLGDPIRDALVKFDSRVCRSSSETPATFAAINGFETLCQSDPDCAAGEVCGAARFDDGQTGLFGSIQEYRLGEQALAEAIHALGIDRFRSLDLQSAALCGGVGCAARLLVRLGALRSLAQAERLELQSRRVFAQGGLIAGELVCSAGDVGASCVVDAECDTTSPANGVCGSGEKERAVVQVRQASAEAMAEAGIAMSLYRSAAPEAIAEQRADLTMLSNALADIASVATRSANSLTPFGVPVDYIPFLSDTQRNLLGCDASVSVFGCLQFLLEDNTVGVLQALDDPANQAPLNLTAYADAVRSDNFDQQMADQLEDVVNRMFGLSCEGAGCTCTTSEQQANGDCFTFQGRTWVVEGVRCADPSDPFRACSTSGVDGALEQQIQSIRNAEVALDNIAADLRRNAENYDQTISSFFAQLAINFERCTALEAAVADAGNAAYNAILDRRLRVGGGTADALESAADIVGGTVSLLATGNPAGLIGAFGGASGKAARQQERREDLDLQAILSDIETNRQIETNRIQCAADVRQVYEVSLPDALFSIETQQLALIGRAKEQQGAVLQAQIAANQLVSELVRARQRFDEAIELEAIWDDQQFKNPQNYRALALEQQLEAADALRRAQLVSWFLLRAVAYDLAQPDTAAPLRQHGAGTVIQLDQCTKARCAADTSRSCITDTECGAFGPCQSSAEPSDIADSNGSCSLQAVFAARDVEDLRSLIRSAFLELALTFRDTACDDGVCEKTVRLQDIFEDAFSPSQPPLGELLSSLPLSANNAATLDFGISLQRGFNICPALPDLSRQCQPSGITGLVDDASGPGDDASDFWNARLISVGAAVRYRPNRAPNANLCRNPANGRPAGPSAAQECFGVQEGLPCPFTTGCTNAAGTPVACRCSRILNGDPNVDLIQAGPAFVRTRSSTPDRDSFLTYQMRTGDLPDVNSDPDLARFRLSNLKLRPTLDQSTPDESVRGIPLASARWQLLLRPTGLLSGAFMREYLTSIEDIQLRFNYEAFNLPP